MNSLILFLAISSWCQPYRAEMACRRELKECLNKQRKCQYIYDESGVPSLECDALEDMPSEELEACFK